jgi:CheY-like chemotaxis protein
VTNKDGPVIIIEDDEDDQFIFSEVFRNLGYNNPVVFFLDGIAALEYLNRTDVVPFLILSDINLPKINGLALRTRIQTNQQLHLKCIPYLFFTTTANKDTVIQAYGMSVHGFFIKPNTYQKLESCLRKIMEYWKECKAPGEYLDELTYT